MAHGQWLGWGMVMVTSKTIGRCQILSATSSSSRSPAMRVAKTIPLGTSSKAEAEAEAEPEPEAEPEAEAEPEPEPEPVSLFHGVGIT